MLPLTIVLFPLRVFDYCNLVEIGQKQDVQPLVDAIVRRRMVEPSIFLLEMCKPLIGCLRELYGMTEPLLHTLLGSSLAPALKRALQSSDDTEALIQALEQARDGAKVV
ncbi:MAG: hypothetical protein RIS36_2182 [Pseudomonadota bacterium]